MTTAAYLRKPLYFKLNSEHASIIAKAISDNAGSSHPKLRNPDYRACVKVKRNGSREVLYFYHIAITEPRTRYKAIYEMIATESRGCYLRYRGMAPRIFTHFDHIVPTEDDLKSTTANGFMFLSLLEEIKYASSF